MSERTYRVGGMVCRESAGYLLDHPTPTTNP